MVRGAPPIASKAAIWQRRTLCRSWWRTNRAHINREAEHRREQPDDALDPRLVHELDLEPGKVDLRLLARRRLEAYFVSGGAGGPDLTHAVPHDAVAAGIAALLDLTEQTPRCQGGIGRQALPQIRFEAIDDAGAGARFCRSTAPALWRDNS